MAAFWVIMGKFKKLHVRDHKGILPCI
jgi:hypothetical protein